MSASAPIALERGNCLGETIHGNGLATPLLQSFVAANRAFIWYEKYYALHFFGSFAWKTAVAMRFDARLAGVQFALLSSCCCPASRTWHGEALLKV